jgi:antitoxin HicB
LSASAKEGKTVRYIYPASLEAQPEGGFTVTFPDVEGAITEGNTKAEALRNAADALQAALGAYIELRKPVPAPSRPAKGQDSVALDALAAAKLGLYQAMRAAGVSNVEPAKRLKITEGAVRRLVDLDHGSKIEGIQVALAALGKHLVIEVRDNAA